MLKSAERFFVWNFGRAEAFDRKIRLFPVVLLIVISGFMSQMMWGRTNVCFSEVAHTGATLQLFL